MKSYIRFLSRNKLYTAIEVVGLSVSLAFIILMSSYVIKNLSYDRDIRDKDDIYICHNTGGAMSYTFLSEEFSRYPEVREFCQFCNAYIGVFMEGVQIERYPLWVSDNFFEFLPYKLISGKADEVFKQDFSAVISESFAERHFPGENPIGRTIEFDYDGTMRNLIVTGIFKDVKNTQILNTDILVNERLIPSIETRGGWRGAVNLVRFNGSPDISKLAHDIYYNSTDEFFKLRLVPELKFTRFDELDVNIGASDPFQNLSDLNQQKKFISVCVILLIFSLLNYIFLTLAFSRFRAKEIATRMLLGTSRWEIMRRLLTEALLLTSVAFAAGALIAVGLEKHVSLLLRSEIDIFSNNAEILWGTVVIILCSVIAALVPAFSMGKVKPIEVIKGESRKKDKMVLGRVFIAVQAGICITIISISLAMYLQTRKMINEPLGYRTDGLIEVDDFYDDVDLYNILQSLPCVNRVGRYSSAPISYSHARRSLGIKDKNSHISAYDLECDRDALSILGIEILEDFNNDENTYFTKSSQRVIESLYESNGVDKERIKHHYGGIVSDFKFGNSATITDGAACVDLTKREGRIGWLLVEVNGDVHAAKDQIVTAFDEAMEDRYVSANPVKRLKDMVKESFTTERNSCMIIGGFSLLCIILTIMALTALSSYYSHLHTHDTAIRKVLGISRREIFWETIWGFIFPVLIGALIGVPLAYMYVSHWLQSYVIRIANSPVIYAVAIIITLLATFAAVSLQTIRLMRTNPAEVLKKE